MLFKKYKNKKLFKKKKITKKIETQLDRLYTDLENPGSLSGFNRYYESLKDNGLNLDRDDVKNYLMSREDYTIHKSIRKQKSSLRVNVSGIDDLWQADLVDVKRISKENDGITFLLTCIDVFSKYAWVLPIKDKSSGSVLKAFQEIIENSSRQPRKIQTDQGNEFFNKYFKAYLKKQQIELYATYSDKKSSVVERFNKTLKEQLWRYFTSNETDKYIDVLHLFVKKYNNSYHKSIKEKPINVTKENEKKIYFNLYGYFKEDGNDQMIEKFKFKINDQVRITKYKNVFAKGYIPNWSTEIFNINKVYATVPPTYALIDYNKELIKGIFYEYELQKVVKNDDVYKVEAILETKGKKPNRKFYVKWKGYGDQFNSWVSEKDFNF